MIQGTIVPLKPSECALPLLEGLEKSWLKPRIRLSQSDFESKRDVVEPVCLTLRFVSSNKMLQRVIAMVRVTCSSSLSASTACLPLAAAL